VAWTEIIQVVFSLFAVLAMIGICAIAARKAGLMTASGGIVRKRRLALVETLGLDPRRRVAIIKCDNTEHLVILGANSETLIEKNLAAPLVAAPDEKAQPQNPFAILKALQKHARRNGEQPSRADAA